MRNIKISQIAKAVITDDNQLREQLATLLNVEERTILDWLRNNDWNNKLTLKASLYLIGKKTTLTEDQIFESENV